MYLIDMSILVDNNTRQLLDANRKKVDSILMKARIASKAIELDISKPTAITTTSNNMAQTKSASKVPYHVVATDFAGSKSKYAGINETTKLKSANIEESPSAYLTIREFQKTGGVKEESQVKSATKRDPTAFMIIDQYLHNKRDYHLQKEEEQEQQQKVKSASKKKSNKLAYLVTRDYQFTGATD